MLSGVGGNGPRIGLEIIIPFYNYTYFAKVRRNGTKSFIAIIYVFNDFILE